MKHFFRAHEIQILLWTSGIFLLSVLVLVLTGLVPSEFKVGGGETFEQKTRTAIREIIDGTTPTITTRTTSSQSSGNTSSVITDISAGQSGMIGQTQGMQGTGSQSTMRAETPVRLEIPSLSIDTQINNPKSTAFEVLDSALTTGVVRYPGSGLLGSGNMFIFGHSTGFSIVQNPAYKIFNQLHNASVGDQIFVSGPTTIAEYRVTSVRKVDKDKALVEFDTNKNMITLSTCDSFGRPQDRYVVEGNLVSVTRK